MKSHCLLIGLFVYTASLNFSYSKDNSAILSFTEIQKLNVLDRVEYTKNLGRILKSKKYPDFNRAVLSKHLESTTCFHGFFSIEPSKCSIHQSKVLRFFSDSSNSKLWEILRYNIQHNCQSSKSCSKLKISAQSFSKRTKPKRVQ